MLEVDVKYELAFEFRHLVERMPGTKICNVIEMKSGERLKYLISCPDDKSKLIVDMAFMTWITNPEFQTYYRDTKAFEPIAKAFKK